MIRLTHYQLASAYMAATDIVDAVADKDSLGSAETFIAELAGDPTRTSAGLSRICVTVDRSAIVAEIDARRQDAVARLSALGIELDPA